MRAMNGNRDKKRRGRDGAEALAPMQLRLRIASEAYVDPRTVARYLDGAVPPRPATRERIEAALKKLGLARLLKRTAQ